MPPSTTSKETASRPSSRSSLPSPPASPNRWDEPRPRLIASVLIIGHLIAMITAPLGFQTRGMRGNSPSVELIAKPVQGYGEFLYLNRGYAFFAPDPGPSHLLQAAIGDPTQQTPGELQQPIFPDLDVHWPRLLYHRHFMLAEFLTETYQPPGPPAELVDENPNAARVWQALRARYEYLRGSYAKHLESVHPGETVSLRRLEHLIPDFLDYHTGTRELNDASFYQVLLDQVPSAETTASDQPLPPAIGIEPGKPIVTEVIPSASGERP